MIILKLNVSFIFETLEGRIDYRIDRKPIIGENIQRRLKGIGWIIGGGMEDGERGKGYLSSRLTRYFLFYFIYYTIGGIMMVSSSIYQANANCKANWIKQNVMWIGKFVCIKQYRKFWMKVPPDQCFSRIFPHSLVIYIILFSPAFFFVNKI